jgi:hypothetical protein
VTEQAGKINAYVCPNEHTTWTRNADAGTTAMLIPCPEVGCRKQAASKFYRVDQNPDLVTHEWYRHPRPRRLSPEQREHVERGGLLLRRLFPPPWPHPATPTEARRGPDGRIVLRLHVAVDVWESTSEQHWVAFDTPNGQLTITVLADDEVQDWAVLGPMPCGVASCPDQVSNA